MQGGVRRPCVVSSEPHFSVMNLHSDRHGCSTAGGSTVECVISAVLCTRLAAMECSFLVMEHENLARARNSSDSTSPSIHTCPGSTLTPLPVPPVRPDPAVLERCFARCGINQRLPLQAASEAIVRPLLRKYSALLPREQWSEVCRENMRINQEVADAMHAAPEPPPPPSTARSASKTAMSSEESAGTEGNNSAMLADTSREEMGLEDLNAGVLAIVQLQMSMLYDALQDSSAVVSSTEHCLSKLYLCVYQAVWAAVLMVLSLFPSRGFLVCSLLPQLLSRA